MLQTIYIGLSARLMTKKRGKIVMQEEKLFDEIFDLDNDDFSKLTNINGEYRGGKRFGAEEMACDLYENNVFHGIYLMREKSEAGDALQFMTHGSVCQRV